MIAVVGLMLSTALYAQTAHEFSIYAGGGISTVKYSVTEGKHKLGLGGHAGLGYTFFFSPNWGLGTGVEFALYNSKFNTATWNGSYTLTDPTPPAATFTLNSTLKDYEEKQTSIMLQIPLMLQFQGNGNHKFYAAAGGKIGLPLSATYKVDNATFVNAGVYPYESYTYTTQIFRGFGSNQKSYKDDLSFKAAFFLAAEAGMKWRLSDNMSLYTGLYLDYGLNNIRKNTPANFVAYIPSTNPTDPTADLHINSVTYARVSNTTAQFTDKLSPLAAGIKLRLAFGAGSKKAAPAPAPASGAVDDGVAADDSLPSEAASSASS